MNFKTTIVLAILIVVGAFAWLLTSFVSSTSNTSPTLSFLEEELNRENLSRIKVERGGEVRLDLKKSKDEWSLPGNWPIRAIEVDQVVDLLAGLHSRFLPFTLTKEDAEKYGLDDALVVKVTVKGKEHTLKLGEPTDDSNRFTRPTYLQLDNADEVVRLAPGLIATLDRPAEIFQERRVFPYERVAKEDSPGEKIEKLSARSITVKDADTDYKLTKTDDGWEVVDLSGKDKDLRDRVDPDKLNSILTGIPDIWAETFVDRTGKKDLADYGLKEPAETLTITRPNGEEVALLIGKQASMKIRRVAKPAPPPQFGQPRQPEMDIVHEEYRYAKLKDNEQVFEIKAERLKDIFTSMESLRDPKLARFKTDDARRLEIQDGDRHIVLVKKEDDWFLEKPYEKKAENSKVTELLDKLRDLEAKDADVLPKADAKEHGLEKPAVVKVAVEETKGKGDKKTTKKQEFTFNIGKKAGEKLYVQVAGWPRVNAVKDELTKLLERPALAYRNRRVLDHSTTDLTKVEVQQPGETFTLEQDKKWELTKPVKAELDTFEVDRLAGDLARLEAVEFVSEKASAEELEKQGLAKPAITAALHFKDAKPATQTLSVGGKRGDKDEYFARLDSDPAIFIIGKDVHEKLTKDSLAYRPKKLWDVPSSDIAEVRVRKDDPEFVLKKDGDDWKVTGPFEAKALESQVSTLTSKLSNLSAERYIAHIAKDLSKYGLEKPYLRVSVTPQADKEAKEPAKERVLLVGSEVEKDKKERYARVGDSEAVFVVGTPLLEAVDHAAVDYLNRDLLSLDADRIDEVRIGGSSPVTLKKKEKEGWQVTDSPAPAFTADEDAVQLTLDTLGKLQAKRYAAYGSKLDLPAYGLDKPAATVAVTLKPADEKAKEEKHTIALGQTVKDTPGARYARIDEQPGVAVLAEDDVKNLLRTHLDFVDPRVLTYDLDTVAVIQRKLADKELEIVKKGDDWSIIKPAAKPADKLNVEGLLEKTFRLRAERVAAYPAKDLSAFGLDKPAAVITLQMPDTGKQHTIKLGKPTDDKTPNGERFALIDDGKAVVVLSKELSELLLADALRFRDHNIASFSIADRIELERDTRKATFTKEDDAWKVTAPIEAKAESSELDELVQGLIRLRADEVVAESPKDLKIYGLEPPQARYRFSNAGKEVLDLQVGLAKGTGAERRAYAKAAGSDLVFLLSPKLTAKALAEYRERKVLTLDAAQVDRLKYSGEGVSFELEKKDGAWQVAGKNVKVDDKAVSETLDALAGLKAERFVADDKGNLQLHGLKPAVLTVEAQSGGSATTLQIGRQEGQSQRRYATAPTLDGAIITISEADAEKIVRNLQAFEKK